MVPAVPGRSPQRKACSLWITSESASRCGGPRAAAHPQGPNHALRSGESWPHGAPSSSAAQRWQPGHRVHPTHPTPRAAPLQMAEAYLACLKQNKADAQACAELSKEYLQCRMHRWVMASVAPGGASLCSCGTVNMMPQPAHSPARPGLHHSEAWCHGGCDSCVCQQRCRLMDRGASDKPSMLCVRVQGAHGFARPAGAGVQRQQRSAAGPAAAAAAEPAAQRRATVTLVGCCCSRPATPGHSS